MGEDSEEVTLGFASKNSGAMPDLTKGPDSKADPIQMPPLTFSKVSASDGMSVHCSVTNDVPRFCHMQYLVRAV
jgi:hypothetical protein